MPETKPKVREARPPADLKTAGKALWRRVSLSEIDFRVDELHLLTQACRIEDVLAELRRKPKDPKARVEIRLQTELQRKLLTSIDWPEDDSTDLSQWGRTLALKRWRRSG